MIRKVASTILAFILLCIVGAGYLYYKQIAKPKNPIINSIPKNAVVIIRSKNIKNSFSKFNNSGIGVSISQLNWFKDVSLNINTIDSLLTSNKVNYSECYMSLHKAGDNYNWIGFFGLNQNSNFPFQISKNETLPVLRVGPKGLYYFIKDDILAASTNKHLVQDAINQYQSKNSLLQDVNFSSLYQSSDKTADVNVYLNYNKYSAHLKSKDIQENTNLINRVRNFAEWSELDINSRSNTIHFNGYTSLSDSSTLNYLKNQEPQEMNLTSVLPVNTASFFYFSFDDFSDYHSKRINNNKKAYLNFLKKTEDNYGIALEDYFLSWVGNEICMGYQKNDGLDKVANSFAVIKSKDIIETNHILSNLINELAKKMEFGVEPKLYRGYKIGFLNLKGILPNLMGDYFQKMNYNFFTSIDDYVIFTNNLRSIEIIIDHYYKKQTLNQNSDFINLSSQLEQKSNLFFYYNIPLSESEILEFVPLSIQDEFKQNFVNFKNIESACIQLTKENKHYYTNGLINYNPNYKEIEIDKWETKLLAEIKSRPYLIKNKVTNQQEIVIQDIENNLYLFNLDGEIIFNTKVDDKVLGEIEQIDFYKNDSYQYIFNTESKIYLVNRKGQNMEDYPVNFKDKATNGLSIFDYDNKKNYRIVLANEKNEIININKNAKLTKGWNKFKVKNKITNSISHFTKKDKDYIYCQDVSGTQYFINRRGIKIEKTELPIKKEISFSLNLDSLSENSNFKALPYATTDSILSHIIIGSGTKLKSFRIR